MRLFRPLMLSALLAIGNTSALKTRYFWVWCSAYMRHSLQRWRLSQSVSGFGRC